MRIKTIELCMCLSPMGVIILPTTLAAAYQLRTGDPYAAVASVSLLCCTAVQIGAAAIATSYINRAMEEPAFLAGVGGETDIKVQEFDERAADDARLFAEASVLSSLSSVELGVLGVGTLLLVFTRPHTRSTATPWCTSPSVHC